MSLIEINKPLLRLTRESGGPCPDTTIRFFGEPPSAVYSYPAGTFITVDLLDENGNYLQIVSYTQVGNNIDIVVDSDTPILVNGTPEGDITNWTPINVNLEDSIGNPVAPVSTALVGNTLTIEIDDDTPIEVNNVAQGDITNGTTIDVNLEDSVGNPVAPISTALVGNTLTIEVPTGVTPSGVAFQTVQANQYISYANYDEGWRWQNGVFDYLPPANPAKRAYINYAVGANAFYVLGQALQVGANSNTTRFVDVDGLQVWPAVNNKNEVVIDKLTGLMFMRNPQAAATWANCLNNADSFSITVDGTTFSDWYIPSVNEMVNLFGFFRNQPWPDPVTGNNISSVGGGGGFWTATTNRANTLQAYNIYWDGVEVPRIRFEAKTGSYGNIYVRKCRNLIS